MELNKVFGLLASNMISEMNLVEMQPEQVRGRAREVIVRRFFEPFLPNNLGVGSGVIVDSASNESGEIDAIIYDRSSFNLFKPFTQFMPESAQPFPCELVHAVVEVENKLTVERLRVCLEKIANVKMLSKSAFYPEVGAVSNVFNLYGKEWNYFPTLGIVFAFDSQDLQELTAAMEQMNKEKSLSLENQIDLVCVLNRGIICHHNREKNMVYFPGEPNCQLIWKTAKPDENLSISYRLTMRVLSQAWTKPIDIAKYFGSKF